MMAGSHGPSGAFTIYRPPWEGFFKPPAMRVVADLVPFQLNFSWLSFCKSL
jgi:hypothetical protein